MKEYKVYGGLTMIKGKQRRTIIAARTKKRAAEIIGGSVSHFRDYWCVTGNETEIKIALAEPETVFIAHGDQNGSDRKYVKLEK